jgi:hypothetical protein
MYGLARAALVLPGKESLTRAAIAIGQFCLQECAVFGGNIYGNFVESGGSEKCAWHSSTPDFAAGYAWLYQLTKQSVYKRAATKILMNAFCTQADQDWPLCTQGGIPVWTRDESGVSAAFGGFYSFWTVLAAKGLEEAPTVY